MTVEEAAKALAVSEGQLRGRLFRGREKLRERLAKRGVALSVSALVVSLTAGTARAVPAALRTAAVASATTGPVSPFVLRLTHEVLAAMSRTKVHLLVASAVLFAGLFTTGVVVKTAAADQPEEVVRPAPAPAARPLPAALNAPGPRDDDEKKEEKIDRREGVVKSVDVSGNKLVVTTDEDKFDLPVDVGAGRAFTVARRTGKLADLKEGMRAVVSFRGAEKDAFKVEAHWQSLDAEVKAVDTPGSKLTIKAEGKNGFELEVGFPVAADVEVEIDGVPAGLSDIKGGNNVSLEFAADKKTVLRIQSEGREGELSATVKAVDAANKAVTLSVKVSGHRHERKVELSFAVTADCTVRVSGKDAKLSDLAADMPVRCQFAADRRTISGVWAGPPRPADKDDD